MTHKGVANSVLKFGGILFTPIQYTAEVYYADEPLKVRVPLWSQNGPLHLLNPSKNTNLYVNT